VKTAIIAAAVVVSCAATASAQSMTAGVKAGFTNSKLSSDNVNIDLGEDEDGVESRTRPGFLVGLFTSFAVTPRFAFQPEFLYVQKGSKLRDDFGDEADLKLDYFEVPLLADIRLNGGENRLSLMVGPTLSFRTKAEIEFEGVSVDLTEDPDDQVEKTDVGITAGVAFTMKQFVLDGRYTWGLRAVNVDTTEEEIKNRSLAISIGWRFR